MNVPFFIKRASTSCIHRERNSRWGPPRFCASSPRRWETNIPLPGQLWHSILKDWFPGDKIKNLKGPPPPAHPRHSQPSTLQKPFWVALQQHRWVLYLWPTKYRCRNKLYEHDEGSMKSGGGRYFRGIFPDVMATIFFKQPLLPLWWTKQSRGFTIKRDSLSWLWPSPVSGLCSLRSMWSSGYCSFHLSTFSKILLVDLGQHIS